MIRRFTLFAQDGSVIWNAHPAVPVGSTPSAWTVCTGAPFGLRVFADGTVDLDNGVGNAGPMGIVYYSRMELEYDTPPRILPRKQWSVSGNVLTIGNTPGGDALAPRLNFRIRTTNALAKRQSSNFFLIGNLSIKLPQSMRGLDQWRHNPLMSALEHGNASYDAQLYSPNFGPHHPALELVSGEGGDHNIAPISGYNGDSLFELLMSDLVLERNALSCVDKATGEPLPTSQVSCVNYTGGRAVNKAGQLPIACHATDNTDARVPNEWNHGTCSYITNMCGVDIYGSGAAPPNFEHLIRGMCHARAGAQVFNDEPCKQTLRMIAQDCYYAWKGIQVAKLGSRECAWVTVATNDAGIAQAEVDAAGPTGFTQDARAPWVSWIPNPGVDQYRLEYGQSTPTLWPGCAQDEGVAQLYEYAQEMVARIQLGHADMALKGMAALYLPPAPGVLPFVKQIGGYMPKFVVVSKGGVKLTSITKPVFWPDYTRVEALGLAGCVDPATYLPHFIDVALPTVTSSITGLPLDQALRKRKQDALHDLPGRDALVGYIAALEEAGY